MSNKLVFDGNQGVATPAGDIINIIGDGINVQTACKANTVLITAGKNPVVKSLTTQKISLPLTNLDGSEGVVYVNGKTFIHSFSVGAPSLYIGIDAGSVSLPSESNVGIGYQSLSQASGANGNVAISSLSHLVSGNFNTGLSFQSLSKLKEGTGNTSVGAFSASNLNSGAFFNTTIGTSAGSNYSSSQSFNVILGCNAGKENDSYTVRIGNDGSVAGCPASQRAFIYGVAGNVCESEVPVYINTKTGQLGTQSSTIQKKINIKDISSSSELLYNLKPVSFNYKGIQDDVVHYGLLAEDVLPIMPELVNLDEQGNPAGVKYTEMISLLLNEIQKLKKEIVEMKPLCAKIIALERCGKEKE